MVQKKRIFISGGAGVIGRSLIHKLLQCNADIYIGDLKPCPPEWVGKLQYRQGDLNTLSFEELSDFNPHLFFHLAATFERSEESLHFFQDNYSHNLKLSHHLLNCCSKLQELEKIVFASSYLIYDPALYLFQEPQFYPTSLSENCRALPRNLCGAAKFFHESELQFFRQFWKGKPSLISARIFRVYGKGSHDLISRWIHNAIKGEALHVYRSEGKFDYVFADDVAEGLFRLSSADFEGTINLGTGKARSVTEVVQILKRHFPSLLTEEIDSDIPFEASEANMNLFQKTTNWIPSTTLEEGISELISYQKLRMNEEKPSQLNILITSISRKIPLIKAVKHALNKIGDSTLHGCDHDKDCLGQYFVDHFWNCPSLDSLSARNFIEYCQVHSIRAIIPTRDQDLVFFSEHYTLFKEQNIKVMVSPKNAINLCRDKLLFAQFLERHGFPLIPTYLNFNQEAQLYVVKDRFGAGSRDLGIRLTEVEARNQCTFHQHPIIQPYISGKEWSVDLYRSLQGKVMGCIARTRDLVIGGESQVTTTHSFPKLENMCIDLANKLEIQGHAVFQVIEDSIGAFHIIECNPRFGGASTASITMGLDSFYWFFLEAINHNMDQIKFIRKKEEIRQVRVPIDYSSGITTRSG